MSNNYAQLFMGKYVTGRGSVSFLKDMGRKRAAIVLDGCVINGEKLEKITKYLKEGGAEYKVVADIRTEPFFKDILKARDTVNEFKPDLIVAIGGGSVIDTAKALWLFYEHPDMAFEDAFKPFQLPPTTGKAVIVAIPTTSGTGSETSSCAVFTNQDTKEKSLMLGNNLIPEYAILDADFTDTLPDHVAAQTGMDALTHAMEASVSTNTNPMVIILAMSAALDLLEYLPSSAGPSTNGESKRISREKCHNAASLAGVAITNSFCGLAHASDQPGPYFKLPHGLVCGMLLPYTTALCCPHPTYATIAKRLGCNGESEKELCSQLVDYLWDFSDKMGISHSVKELKVDEKEYMEHLPQFVQAACQSMSSKLSPHPLNEASAEKLFKDIYYGIKPKVE